MGALSARSERFGAVDRKRRSSGRLPIEA